MPIELWKQGKEIFNGQRFNNRLRYFPLFSFIWCNPQHYEGLKPSRYTGIINKNQIYIIMESQYKVCEVKLTYKSKIKASEREKILSAENAYKILLSVFDSETIQYKEFFKVILMNRANKVLGVCHISEGGLNETSADIRIIMQAAILGNASAIILALQSSVWEHTTKYARRSSDKKSKGDCQIDWYQPSGSSYHNG